jgi:hypothetical protein
MNLVRFQRVFPILRMCVVIMVVMIIQGCSASSYLENTLMENTLKISSMNTKTALSKLENKQLLISITDDQPVSQPAMTGPAFSQYLVESSAPEESTICSPATDNDDDNVDTISQVSAQLSGNNPSMLIIHDNDLHYQVSFGENGSCEFSVNSSYSIPGLQLGEPSSPAIYTCGDAEHITTTNVQSLVTIEAPDTFQMSDFSANISITRVDASSMSVAVVPDSDQDCNANLSYSTPSSGTTGVVPSAGDAQDIQTVSAAAPISKQAAYSTVVSECDGGSGAQRVSPCELAYTFSKLSLVYADGVEILSGSDYGLDMYVTQIEGESKLGITSLAIKIIVADNAGLHRTFTGRFESDSSRFSTIEADLYDENLNKVARLIRDENEIIQILYYGSSG